MSELGELKMALRLATTLGDMDKLLDGSTRAPVAQAS